MQGADHGSAEPDRRPCFFVEGVIMPSLKLLHRAAARLHAAWLAKLHQADALEGAALQRLRDCQRSLQQAADRCQKARQFELKLILPQLRHDMLGRVKALHEAAGLLRQQWEQAAASIPSLRTWIAELHQVEEEFNDLGIDLKRKSLHVTTEPITLADVYLGSFAIVFSWNRWPSYPEAYCFDIIALEPNPASTDDRVTHPHVKNAKLCAGGASTSLRRALEQGRLADAFCLIRSVLNHYNPLSPHVRLDNWGGGPECRDCGHMIPHEQENFCERCGSDFCDECFGRCTSCDTSRCYGCLGHCAVCEEHYCPGCLRPSAHSQRECCSECLQTCAACGAEVASDEIAPDTDRCLSCLASQPSPSDATAQAPVVSTPILTPSPQENDHAETLELPAPAAV